MVDVPIARLIFSHMFHAMHLRQNRALISYVSCCLQLIPALQQWREWFCCTRQPLRKVARAGAVTEHSGAVDGIAGLIGNTPLVRIGSLSKLTGCEVSLL